MPAKTPQFGDFVFDVATGIYNSRMKEMSPAERDLTILGRAGSSGMSILRSRRKGKTVVVGGIILRNSSSSLIASIREMSKKLMAEGSGGLPVADLQFQNEEGTWIYDDAILLNPESLFPDEETHFITWMPFTAVFFCPTGVARSISQTIVNFDDITSTPETDSITISGTVAPDVLIAVTFDMVSSITEFTFTNTTTGEQITVNGLSISNGDVVYIDNEKKEVRVNSTKVAFDGIFPTFLPGLNAWQLAVAGTDNVTEEQTDYDDVEQVYGDNWISQEFKAGNEDISQLALFLEKVEPSVFQLLDNFDNNNIDTSIWKSRAGTFAEEGGELRVGKKGGSGGAGNVNTSTREGTEGYEVAFRWVASGTEGFDVLVYIQSSGDDATGGTIEARSQHAVNKTVVQGTGNLSGLGSYLFSGSSATIKVEQVGTTLKVFVNGTLRLSGTFELGSSPICGLIAAPGSSSDFYIAANIVNEKVGAIANSDIDVRIEEDTGGKPNGSLVSNGSLTIPAAAVGSSFSKIIAAFATAPTLTAATIYHLLVKQVGGDVNNYYRVRKNTEGGYDDGTLERSDDGGASWDNVAAEDLWFRLWTTLPSNFNIDIELSYYESYYGVI